MPRVSGDGRFVTFRSTASNLHLGGSVSYYSIFLRDLARGETRKVSLSSADTGHQVGVGNSEVGGVSLTGRYIVFSSVATNLVAGDGNGFEDVFVRDRHGAWPYSYGWSEPQTIGCVPSIGATGTPSASAGSGFYVTCSDVRSQQPGMMIYSTAGPAAVSLFGGFLYVGAPIVRTPVQSSGGTPGTCNGSFSLDVNALVGSPGHAGLSAGVRVWAQYWSRDPGDPDGAHLSDALELEMGI